MHTRSETTHVVVAVDARGMAPARTMKLLQGMAAGAWVLAPAWLEACLAAGGWVPERHFEVKVRTV